MKTCSICSKTFKTSNALKQHEQTKHGANTNVSNASTAKRNSDRKPKVRKPTTGPKRELTRAEITRKLFNMNAKQSDAWLRSQLTPRSYRWLMNALSPNENLTERVLDPGTANTNAIPRDGLITGLEVGPPEGIGEDNWDLFFIGFPGMSQAGIYVTVKSGDPIPPINLAEETWTNINYPDTPQDLHHGPNPPDLDPFDMGQHELVPTCWSTTRFTGLAPGAIPFSYEPREKEDHACNLILGETFSVDNKDIRSWQCDGYGVTTHLVADSLSDRGMVYSTNVDLANSFETLNVNLSVFKQVRKVPDEGGQMGKPVYINGTIPVNNLIGFPSTVSQMASSSSIFTGEAREGNYVVSKFMGRNYNDLVLGDRCAPIALSFADSDSNYLPNNTVNVVGSPKAYNYSTETWEFNEECALPLSDLVDPAWTPVCVVYHGLSPKARVNFKIVNRGEFVPQPKGSMSRLGTTGPIEDPHVSDVALTLAHHIPAGGPASSNFLGTLLKALVTNAPAIISLVGNIFNAFSNDKK